MFLNNVFLQGGVVSTSPNPQAGGPPLVGCPRLLIQFIRSRSSIRNLRTRHAVVTRTHFTVQKFKIIIPNITYTVMENKTNFTAKKIFAKKVYKKGTHKLT